MWETPSPGISSARSGRVLPAPSRSEPDYVIEDIYQVFPILRELMDKENQMFSLGAAGSA